MFDRLKSMNRWLLTAFICLLIFAVLATVKFFQIRAAIAFGESFPESSESVETVVARSSLWQPYVKLSASARASRDVVLRTEVDGVIKNISFASGGEVEAGTVILELDASEEQARREATRAEITFAEKDAKRTQGLSNQGAISRQQQDQIQTRLSVAKAELANIEEAISNKKVIAPFTGVAGIHDFEVGEFVRSGTVVTRLVGDLDRLWLDFALPQQFANVEVGTIIQVRQDGAGALPATVIAIEPAISAESRTLRARAELIDPDRQIKPGSFVKITVPVGEQVSVHRIPVQAVRKDELGDFVFLVEKGEKNDWRAVRRPIEVARIEGNQAVIERGLEDQDQVATTGSFKLKPGILVNITSTEEIPSEQTSTEAAGVDVAAEVEVDSQETSTDEVVVVDEVVDEPTPDTTEPETVSDVEQQSGTENDE